jgi:hypothetical protein
VVWVPSGGTLPSNTTMAPWNGFPYWKFDRDENNLEKIFPDDPMMLRVDRLLST